MRRVVRPGGTVAACAWDLEHGPVHVLWRAADELFPGASGAIDLPCARDGQLADLMTAAGLEARLSTTLSVQVQIATFEEWWAPFAFGIGPAGEYVARLTDGDRERLRARCVELLPDEPLEIVGVARVATSRRAQT